MTSVDADANPPKLRVLVLEDEWVARNFLVELIEASGVAHVVGAVAALEDATELLETANGIDAVFVDINLSGSDETGLSLVRGRAGQPGAPQFVLATAARDHALEAFELGVVDYVTKPFSKERVAQCLQRLDAKRTPHAESVPNRIVARKRRSLVFLAIEDIWAFESSDRLTCVHSPHGVYDIDLSLAAIELSFGRRFVRTHRNWLVNSDHIRELDRDAGESTLLVGSGYADKDPGIRVPVARDRSQAIRDQLLRASPGVRRR
jgi:two-component system, LytTR family, response regulator LytT